MISRSKAFRSRKTVMPSQKPKDEWAVDEESEGEEEETGEEVNGAKEEGKNEALKGVPATKIPVVKVTNVPEEKGVTGAKISKDVPVPDVKVEPDVSKIPKEVAVPEVKGIPKLSKQAPLPEVKGQAKVSKEVSAPEAKGVLQALKGVLVPGIKIISPQVNVSQDVPGPEAKVVTPASKEPEPSADLIKKEILQGVSSDPSATDFPSSRTLKGGQLAKIREEHLKKRGLKHVTMPELAETSETESVKGSSMDSDSDRSSHGDKMAEINITENPIYPSLPDQYLKKLGVDKDSDLSPDQLSEQELEEKFASLSLAFKTDKQTLEQRVQLQERARDMAEQNVDKEVEGIRKTIKDLGQVCTDAECREVMTKLQQHIEVLEQSTARVSSRAELHGAVQQEDRMSRAIEIMVTHVDRLRLLYEREHQELEDTRKLLQENRILPPGASADFGAQGKSGHHSHLRNHTGALTSSRLGQSSASSQLDEAGKRRASVASFPRLFGSLGSSSGNLADKSVQDVLNSKPVPMAENPKQRFQNVVANTTMTNAVTGFLRRSSQDKSKTPPPESSANDCTTPEPQKTSAPATPKHTTLSPDDALKKPSPIKKVEASADGRRTSNSNKLDEKEEVFQKGFEQGVRTSISAELNDLKEQQAFFCDSLENLMEDNQDDDEDDEENKEHFLDKMWQYVPEWDKSGKKLRLILASIIFMMGILSIMVTLMPVAAAPVPRHSLQEMVSPYIQLKYFGKKPL